YYIADGTYPRYNFNTAQSGTTLITIKKAIHTDHCTDTGYNDATMGSAQAVFVPSSGQSSIWQFSTSGYWTIDGQSSTGLKSGHGIELDNSGLFGTPARTVDNCINLSGTSSNHVTNVTIKYVECAGGGVLGNQGDSYSI